MPQRVYNHCHKRIRHLELLPQRASNSPNKGLKLDYLNGVTTVNVNTALTCTNMHMPHNLKGADQSQPEGYHCALTTVASSPPGCQNPFPQVSAPAVRCLYWWPGLQPSALPDVSLLMPPS